MKSPTHQGPLRPTDPLPLPTPFTVKQWGQIYGAVIATRQQLQALAGNPKFPQQMRVDAMREVQALEEIERGLLVVSATPVFGDPEPKT